MVSLIYISFKPCKDTLIRLSSLIKSINRKGRKDFTQRTQSEK